MADQTLYDSESVRRLFDEMASTYGIVNIVASFGFAVRWRHQAIAGLPPTTPLHRVVDLMSGMGELWRSLATMRFWVRFIGWHGFAVTVFLAVVLGYLLFSGGSSWYVAVSACTLSLAVVVGPSVYFVYRHRALATFRSVRHTGGHDA